MITKSINSRVRWLSCFVVLAMVFAVFLTGLIPDASAGNDIFEDVELRVGDALGFVYYTSQPYTANTQMRFEINGRSEVVNAYSNDGKCVFVFSDIYPHELAQEIKATVVVDGKDVISSDGLSMKKYLLETLLDNSKSKYYELASNILQYGEATRLYRNANVPLDERDEQTILDFDTTVYTNYQPKPLDDVFPGSVSGLGVSAANVRLSAIGIAYHNTNQYVITITTPTNIVVNMNNVTINIDNDEYTYTDFINKGNGEYELRTKPINGNILANPVDISLKVNGSVAQQAQYSSQDYVLQLQESDSNALALNYAKALHYYGISAQEFGKRIIAVETKSNPKDITVSSTNPNTPAGGSVIVYYSDGTSEEVTKDISWSNTDINNQSVAIIDNSSEKTFTIKGSYTCPMSGRVFTHTGKVVLINPVVSVERYHDGNTYKPTSYLAQHTPKGGKIKCLLKNGTERIVGESDGVLFSSTNNNISNFATTEYAQGMYYAAYKDPATGTPYTVELYFLYENPVKSINIAASSCVLTSASVNPKDTNVTITYTNGKTITKKVSELQNKGDNQRNFKWTAVNYTGTKKSDTINVNATLSAPKNALSFNVYQNGVSKQITYGKTNSTYTTKDISGVCSVSITNPVTSILISTLPTLVGGTVVNTDTPVFGTQPGNLTGGAIRELLTNGQKGNAISTGVTYKCSSGISDTSYSKTVTLTATYNGMTAKRDLVLYNKLVSVTQSKDVVLEPTNTSANVKLTLAQTAGTLCATYANGLQSNDISPLHLLINNEINDNTCYIKSITTASNTKTRRTTATTSVGGDTYQTLTVSYKDTRTTNNPITVSCSYSCIIFVKPVSLVTGQRANDVTMTSATNVPSPANKSLQVLFSNGTTAYRTFSFSNPGVINGAIAYEDHNVTATYEATISDTKIVITGTVPCKVRNPLSSISPHSQGTCYAKNYSITTFNVQQNSNTDLGARVMATFTNGAKQVYYPTIYSTTINNITDGSYQSKTASTAYCTIDGVTKSCTLNIWTYNPMVSFDMADTVSLSFKDGNEYRSTFDNTFSGTYTLQNGKSKTCYPTPKNTPTEVATYSWNGSTLTTTYKGSSRAYWEVYITFTFTQNNATKEDTVKVCYYNKFDIICYMDSGHTKEALKTVSSSSGYDYIWLLFDKGNQTNYSFPRNNYYPIIKFDNGATKEYKGELYTDSTLQTTITHNKNTIHLNGDSFVCNNSSSGSIRTLYLTYSLNDKTVTKSYCFIPKVNVEHKYKSEDIKVKSGCENYNFDPEYYCEVWVRHVKVCSNGVESIVSSGYQSGALSSTWYSGYPKDSNPNVYDERRLNACKSYTAYAGRQSRSNIVNFDSKYFIGKLRDTITLDGNSCTPYDSNQIYSYAVLGKVL